MRLALTLAVVLWTLPLFSQNGIDNESQSEAISPSGSRGVPATVRFGGAVRSADGEPRSGAVGLTFAIYAAPQGGAPLWLETQNVQLDAQGRYSVLLGASSPQGLPQSIFSGGEARWLGVQVAEEGAAEQPRIALVSVPYALTAADAQTLGGRPASAYQLTKAARLEAAQGDAAAGSVEVSGAVNSSGNTANRIAKFTGVDTIGDSLLFDNGISVGIGTTSPASPLHVEANNDSAAMRVIQNNVNGYALLVRPSNDFSPAFLMNNAANTANKHVFYGSGDAGLGLGGGRIGIGTTGPASPLHVEANNASAAVRIVQNNPNGYVLLVQPGTDGTPAFLMNNAANTANRHVFYGSGEALFALGGGNVGIGTNLPSQKLHVAGQIYSSTGGYRFPDGTVQTTAATGSGGGDITAVLAGTGLSGGGTSGDVTLSVNPVLVQSRVTGECPSGQYMRIIAQNGSVTCGVDSGGGSSGTVTQINTGEGLTGGPITTTGTISVDSSVARRDAANTFTTVTATSFTGDSTLARTNTNNNFSTSQTVNGTLTATSLAGSGAGVTNVNAAALGSLLPTDFEKVANKNAANGYAGLDASSKVFSSALPTNVVLAGANNTFTGSNTFSAGTQDFSTAGKTLPIKTITGSLPTSCTANKEMVVKTDGTAGQQLYLCNGSGTGFNLVGDGNAGGSLTFNPTDGLYGSYSNGVLTAGCSTASASTKGCVTSSDFSVFQAKLSTVARTSALTGTGTSASPLGVNFSEVAQKVGGNLFTGNQVISGDLTILSGGIISGYPLFAVLGTSIPSVPQGSSWIFLGTPVNATVPASASRISGSVAVGLGKSTSTASTIHLDLCYQVGNGTVTDFGSQNGLSNYLNVSIPTAAARLNYAIANSVVVSSSGTYKVGACIRNQFAGTLDFNDYASGWFMVTK